MGLAASIRRPGDHFCILPAVKISYVLLALRRVLSMTLGAPAITRFILLQLRVYLLTATDIETKKVNIYLERGIDMDVESLLTLIF